MATLEGPSLAPADGGAPDSIVILLHGVGANGDDLLGVAHLLSESFPRTAFHSPNAPFPFGEAPFGYQWYARQPQEARGEGLRAVEPMVSAFIDEMLAEYRLEPSRCVGIGFSQGSAVMLHTVPRRETGIAGVVAFSGGMHTRDSLEAEIRNRTPFLLVHGTDDNVVPVERSKEAGETFERLGVPVELHLMPGLGHSINAKGMELAVGFIQQVLDSSS